LLAWGFQDRRGIGASEVAKLPTIPVDELDRILFSEAAEDAVLFAKAWRT
jgi:hypothetical protein